MSQPLAGADRMEVRLRRFSRPMFVTLPCFAIVIICLLLSNRDVVQIVACILMTVLLGGAIAFQLAFVERVNRSGPVMILDARGLTVRGYPHVPWSRVDHLTVAPLGGPVSRLLLVGTGWGKVVAFVPVDGAEMPPPPGGRQVSERKWTRWEAARTRSYGTNLTVVPSLFTVSTDELIGASQSWGGVEVVHLTRNPRVG